MGKMLWHSVWMAVLVCSLFLLASCVGRDPADTALADLDTAISALESQISDYAIANKDPTQKDGLKMRRDNLTTAGAVMQKAYPPVRDLELAKLTRNQETRRSELQQRAVAAAADLLNILLGKDSAF